MFTLERIADELRDVVAGLDPATYDGRDAARLTEVAADGEKLFATAKALLARRAADTRGWASQSHAATPQQWLANVSGCTQGAAIDILRTVERLDECPATEAKLRDGRLSMQQASLVSEGASLDPGSEAKLLQVAERGEIRRLRAEKERVVAAVTDEHEAQDRAQRSRHLRIWTRGVETHGAFSGPTTEVHKLLDALEPLRKHTFDAARTQGERESQDAYMFDALIALSQGEGADAKEPVGRVRVDITPLLNGATASGEVCEIPGVGPVR